jgi:hypothetical protein
MQSTAKPKAADDPHDFIVVPSDQVQVAPSEDAEITDLLRAAARHRSESGNNAAADQSGSAPLPAVDTTFRATAVNDDVLRARGRSSFGRRAMRAIVALVLAAGIAGAAAGWQVFGYATKKTFSKWLPQFALNTSLPLDKLGFGTQSRPAEPAAAEEAPAQAAPAAQAASDSADVNAAATPGAPVGPAAPPSESAQLLQSMARDLANVRQEVETLKASIAELKASQQQQQVTRDRAAEQNVKPRIASAPPRPVGSRKSATVYSPSPTPLGPAPAYRPPPSYAPAPAAMSPVQGTGQPYVSRPAESQPQSEQPGFASVPRPPMPVQ